MSPFKGIWMSETKARGVCSSWPGEKQVARSWAASGGRMARNHGAASRNRLEDSAHSRGRTGTSALEQNASWGRWAHTLIAWIWQHIRASGSDLSLPFNFSLFAPSASGNLWMLICPRDYCKDFLFECKAIYHWLVLWEYIYIYRQSICTSDKLYWITMLLWFRC